MTRQDIEPFVGKLVLLVWRDPVGECGWSDKPLKIVTVIAKSAGWIQGFNERGELVIAGSHSSDGDLGDRTAIPVALVESIVELREAPAK